MILGVVLIGERHADGNTISIHLEKFLQQI
ncbi:hypothetical protein [Porphyromonas phage phage007a_Bg4]